MKLYGHFISLTTLQVLILLAEKGAGAELRLVDVFAKQQKSASHRALHPFGHIPVLDHDGFCLYETHAILRYCDASLPGQTFIPDDRRARARMDQWLCIEQNYLLSAAKKIMAREYAKMMQLSDPGTAIVEEGTKELGFAIEQFGGWIGGKSSIAETSISLADLCWAADLRHIASHLTAFGGVRRDARIAPWLERVSARPSFSRAEAMLATLEHRPKD